MLQGVVNYGTGRRFATWVSRVGRLKTGTTNSGETCGSSAIRRRSSADLVRLRYAATIAYNASGGRLAAPAWAEVYQAGWREPKTRRSRCRSEWFRLSSIRRRVSWRRVVSEPREAVVQAGSGAAGDVSHAYRSAAGPDRDRAERHRPGSAQRSDRRDRSRDWEYSAEDHSLVRRRTATGDRGTADSISLPFSDPQLRRSPVAHRRYVK